jgi:hypothetical protein
MTADRAALVEKVAEIIKQVALGYASVDAASTAAIDLIRAEVLEEAANVAETCQWWESELMEDDERKPIAAAIRALKGSNG